MISVEQIVHDMDRLPSLELSLDRIAALAMGGGSSAGEIEEALVLDAALTGTVLRLANSAYFGEIEILCAAYANDAGGA